MQLVSGRESSDAFTQRIASLTDGVKQNMEYKRQFMEWERQKTYLFNKGKEEGIATGKQEAKIESARNLLRENISPEIVSKCIGLSLEDVEKLAAEVSNN